MAAISGITHVAVRTADLEGTVRFYTEILSLELKDRPDFGMPGAWLGSPGMSNDLVHLYAGEAALMEDGSDPIGSMAVDHFAVVASGYQEFRKRFADAGLEWREQLVPGTQRWQLFVYDPNGVMIELAFDGAQEDGPGPDMSPGRAYKPGVSFFQQSVS